MSDYQDYARAECLTSRSSEILDCGPAEPDDLRTRAARYRLLAETLVDWRVIAVVQACAHELETEALSIETADDAGSVIQPNQEPR